MNQDGAVDDSSRGRPRNAEGQKRNQGTAYCSVIGTLRRNNAVFIALPKRNLVLFAVPFRLSIGYKGRNGAAGTGQNTDPDADQRRFDENRHFFSHSGNHICNSGLFKGDRSASRIFLHSAALTHHFSQGKKADNCRNEANSR